MYLYNVTNKVAYGIEKEWLTWVKTELMEEMKATNLFTDATLFHLDGHDDDEGATYVIQYPCASYEAYQTFTDTHEEKFRQQAFDKFGSMFIAFKTIMKSI